MAFVHLHNHTEYSLLDGATKVDEMAEYAYSLGMSAIAITDHGYMYGVPEFVKACDAVTAKAKKQWKAECEQCEAEGKPLPPEPTGIKPIIGCEAYFTPDSTLSKDRKPEIYHMILLAKNNVGYHNLMKIISEAAVEGFYYRPRTTLEMYEKYHEGVIATSACMSGIVSRRIQEGNLAEAEEWACKFAEIFGKDDFYIELQDHGIQTDSGMYENEINVELDRLAKKIGLKTIATNDIHYLKKEDYITQDLMLCVGTNMQYDDPTRWRYKEGEFYLRTEEEMRELFKDYPDACDNTVEIAEKCNVTLSHDLVLPSLPLPEGETNETMLRKVTLEGLKKRYGDPLSQEVMERMEYELDIICTKGFAAYFLIVQEFTQWAKNNGVGVGPGRGSAAGSIVSYALDITTFDPLENGLLFERFLSPERTEMPDIDMDFDDERRGDVINHVKEVYGEEKIANIITFGKMKAKQAVQDAARVLGFPLSKALEINKLFLSPFANIAGTMGTSKKESDNSDYYNPDFVELYKHDPEAKQIIDTAIRLEGMIRGEGVHASAVVICRDPIKDHVPAKLDTKEGALISQYDGVNVADLGLLKMDFLGLRTLTVISKALQNIYENYGKHIDLNAIDFKDPAIYNLFARGDTAGVFQVESAGLTSLLQRMKPDRYSDIIASIALYRPGPLSAGMVEDFVDRKLGKKKIVYYDERLKDILEDTYGTIVYQEQVMLISIKMSGFTAGESDKVRKAVAKKKIDLMTKKVQKWADGQEETMMEHWLNGAVRNGYDIKVAQKIWDDVEKFASYAFNKSHSAAYAIITLQTAWLKAYYPREYMAAVLTSFMGKQNEKMKAQIATLKAQGVQVLPPDVNSSRRDFTAVGDDIRFGLAGIKGIGYAPADAIIAEREANGPYTSVHDFVNRIPTKYCNKKCVELLIKSGALDSTGYTRRQMMLFLERDGLMESAAQHHKDIEMGQVSMFDMFADEDSDSNDFKADIPAPDGIEWDRKVKLDFEKDALGMYISDHPLSPYQDSLDKVSQYKLSVFSDVSGEDDEMDNQVFVPTDKSIVLAGMVTDLTYKLTKRGDRMATFTLESMDGTLDCVVFAKTLAEYGDNIAEEKIVKVVGRYDNSDRGAQMRVSQINALDFGKNIFIEAQRAKVDKEFFSDIRNTLIDFPGTDKVTVTLMDGVTATDVAELPMRVDSKNVVLLSTLSSVLQGRGRVKV